MYQRERRFSKWYVNVHEEPYSLQPSSKVKLHLQTSEHLPVHLFLSQNVPQVLQERQGD